MVPEQAQLRLNPESAPHCFWHSTRFRLTMIICAVAIIPLILGGLILARLFEAKLIQTYEADMKAMAHYLARRIQAEVPEVLTWDAVLDWDALHTRVAPLAEDLVVDHGDLILGFYSAKVKGHVAYAPEREYAHNLGLPLRADGPVFAIYETKQPLLAQTESRAGPALFYAYPMIVGDRVIGHTFAIITIAEIKHAMMAIWSVMGLGVLLLSLLIWATAVQISRYLTRDVDRIVHRIRPGPHEGADLTSHIPELAPLVAEVEQVTDTLRQQRQHSWDLLDALPLGVVACGPDRRLSFVNETAAEILGVPVDGSIGQHCSEFLLHTSLVKETDLRVVDEVASCQREAGYGLMYYRDADGDRWPMHALILPFGEGGNGQRGVLTIFYDLRKELGYERLQGLFDKEMRKSQVILETLRLGVVAVDHDGILTTCNAATGRLLGIDPTFVVGQTIDHLPREMAELLRGALRSQQICDHLPVACCEKDLQVDIAPLPSSGGVVAVIGDVTLWNKMNRDAHRSDRLALIGEMAAGTAHEIRNPLTTLRGFLQLLRQRMGAEPSWTSELEWVDLMLGEADQINFVVNEFLQLARSRERKISVTDPAKIAQAIFPVIQNECLLRDMVAHSELDPDLPLIEVDPEQIKQVVLNLAQNGIQAMDKGGALTLAIRHDRSAKQIAISVTDQGCGIAATDLKRIFNPFYTTREAGTGLGLAICQRIVEDHHGQITVSSELGRGSTFTVLLPVAASAGSDRASDHTLLVGK